VDREGTERVITQEKRTFGIPRISPDGRQVSVTVYEDDGSRNVWIYSFEQDSFSRLTFDGNLNSTQIWSPDGKWIAYQSGRAGLRGLYRQLADGSGPPQQLTALTQTAQVPDSWSPDGRVLTFNRSNDIWVLPIDGDEEPQPLIDSAQAQCCSQFSPDGKWLAYVSNDTGLWHVYISPYPNPNVKWQVSGEEGGGQPVWSPDGRELFYISSDQMLVVSVQMEPSVSLGKPTVLFEGSYVTTQFGFGKQYYDISHDGQQFVMIKEAGQAQINVVLNWFEELKRLVPTN
jgi:serine/threonine-protein kinase